MKTMGTKRTIIAAAVLAGTLSLCPTPALAQNGDTGTTEVTVIAGPGWGQKQDSGAQAKDAQAKGKKAGGNMPQTGDPSVWAPFLMAGAAACAAGLAITSRTKREDTDEDKR